MYESDEDVNANNTEEVRFKTTTADHEFLGQVALATGEDGASIARQALREYLNRKRHEYKVASRFRLGEGIAAESSRSVGK